MSQFYDQASLVMIPSGYKNGKVYSQKPLSADGELTFTRASNASRVNADGKVERVRTNLLTYSQDFSNVIWSKGNVTITGSQTDPNGGTTATSVDATNGANGTIKQTITLTSGVTYTWSVYIKGSTTGQSIALYTDGASNVYSKKGITTSWQRFTIQAPATSSGYSGFYVLCGSGYSGLTDLPFDIAFAQVEVSDFGATPYIPTTTAAVSVGPVSGLPRLDYSGGASCPSLLLEPQRTNQVIYSEYFDASYWTKTNSTIVNNATLSPEGVQNAKELSDNATSGVHYIYRSGISASANHIISFFAKANTLSEVFVNGGASLNAYVDLINGVKLSGTANTTIENYGNGWWRISIISDRDGVLISTSKNGNNNYSGSGESIYIYGIQSEEAATYATSYIPTLGSAVTRLADSAYKTGISSLIGQTEGTIFLEVERLGASGFENILFLGDGTLNTFVNLVYDNAVSRYKGQVRNGGVTSGVVTAGAAYTGRIKIAVAYALNDLVLYINGVLQDTDTSVTVPSTALSILGVGSYYDTAYGADIFRGAYSQALLFKTRLTNAQLAELTAL